MGTAAITTGIGLGVAALTVAAIEALGGVSAEDSTFSALANGGQSTGAKRRAFEARHNPAMAQAQANLRELRELLTQWGTVENYIYHTGEAPAFMSQAASQAALARRAARVAAEEAHREDWLHSDSVRQRRNRAAWQSPRTAAMDNAYAEAQARMLEQVGP
jgi:hypothetical protein